MKPRLLDVMGDALRLVRKSHLSEATALIRRALSGQEMQDRQSVRPPEPRIMGRLTLVRQPEAAEALFRRASPSMDARGRESDPPTEPDADKTTLTLALQAIPTETTVLLRQAPSGEETRDRQSAPAPERHADDAPHLAPQPNLAEAAALLRKAFNGERTERQESDVEAQPAPPPRPRRAPPPPTPRPLGEVLRALRARPAFVPGERPEPRPRPEFGERFAARVYRGEAGALNYRLYTPADTENRDLALVLMLHGCTQDPEDFALGTQMNSLADEFGLIVAYPHQPRRANASGCWNWFDKRHQSRGSGEPAKLAGLAQALAREFGVRKERIFVAGLSAGGAMAEVLAATYPDVFEAVGVHSGLPYKSAVDVPSAFAAMKGTAVVHPGPPVARHPRKIVIHGGADATVHPVNGERIRDQASGGARPLERIDLDWEADGGRVNRTVLKDAEGRKVVEHWFVEGGGHAWFGGDLRGTYTQSVGVDASRAMVRFFLDA